jgi:hypothetical protein
MEQNILDPTMMLRYLLGLLSEEERTGVEESFFQDDTYFEQLRALEDDLIDDYVRGRLSLDTRKAFEEKLRSSNRWKERVRFAEALDWRTGQQAAQAQRTPSASASLFQVLINAFRNQRPVFQVAIATASLMVLGGVVSLAWQVFEQHGTLQRAQTERQYLQTMVDELKSQIAGLQKRDQDLSRQLDEERLKHQGSENKRPSSALGTVASFVLRAGLVRGNDSPVRLTLPPAARTVRLQLELNPADEYPTYRAELRTAKGTAVATRDPLKALAAGGGKAVTLELPAQSLPAGQYEVELLGRVEQGKLEEIAYYYFDVQVIGSAQ